MDSDPTLFFILLLILYLLFRDFQPRTPPPAPVSQSDVPPNREARTPEGRGSVASHPDPSSMQVDEEGANLMPREDTQWAAFEGREPALGEGIFPGFAAGSSASMADVHDQQKFKLVQASASKSNILSGNPAHTGVPLANPGGSSISVSTLGPSFVNKFAGLKVNTSYSFLASRRATPRDRTPPSSPLSTPPSSPFFSSSVSSFQTPVAFRERPSALSNSVDFSLYMKKIRVLTKSPKKSQTKTFGKSAAHESAGDVTTTTWFYKTLAGPKLLDTPPDLTGHPNGLALGDVYFDCTEDQYQLWLWCLDNIDAPYWKKIPFGYEREDGKRLIVTRKIHYLSWVTTKYYKELINNERVAVGMDVDKD